MRDQIAGVIGFTVILGVGVMIGITSAMVSDTRLQQEAIKRGFAEYNSTNGNWQWKERVTMTNWATVTNEARLVGTLEGPNARLHGGTLRLENALTNNWVIVTNNGLGGVITLNGGER